MHEDHPAHEGPCLPLAGQARDQDAPQGICDTCSRLVTKRGRKLTPEQLGVVRMELHGLDNVPEAMREQVREQLTNEALAGLARDMGVTRCGSCGQINRRS